MICFSSGSDRDFYYGVIHGSLGQRVGKYLFLGGEFTTENKEQPGRLRLSQKIVKRKKQKCLTAPGIELETSFHQPAPLPTTPPLLGGWTHGRIDMLALQIKNNTKVV